MPRVLRITNRFNLGGPMHNVALLSRYMPPEFETLLIGGPPEASEENGSHLLSELGMEALVLPEMNRDISPIKDRSAYLHVKRVIKEFKPDIVHTHAAKSGFIGRLAAMELGVKCIVHTFHGHVFHSYFGPARTAFFKNIERSLAKRTSRIIAISERQKKELVEEHRICRPEKASVIPLGFDLTKFQEDQLCKRALFRHVYGVADDEIAIGIIGRLVPVKNHALFLKALDYVRQRTGKKIRAFIVGDGTEKHAILDQASSLGLRIALAHSFNGHGFGHGVNGKPIVTAADVTFTSWIKEVDYVHAGVDVVVLTSFNEGTPVSLIEAQAAARPVVSTKVGGIENVVLQGVTGLLSPNGDVEALGRNLLKVVEDEALRNKLSGAGRAHVAERFHYTRLVKETASLYYELLK